MGTVLRICGRSLTGGVRTRPKNGTMSFFLLACFETSVSTGMFDMQGRESRLAEVEADGGVRVESRDGMQRQLVGFGDEGRACVVIGNKRASGGASKGDLALKGAPAWWVVEKKGAFGGVAQ